MLTSFDQLPDDARVWIYQMDRELTPSEQEVVSSVIKKFCESWQVHGQNIRTSFKLEYNHFLILAVDESQVSASGCSIDSSVHALKALQANLGIDFFDRKKTAFLRDGKIELISLQRVKEKLKAGVMNAQTITFNNMVTSKGELADKWKIAIKDSWLARHLPKGALA
ncbi:MAG: hypothetical protein AB7K37_01065 [Cyclobacteriaceae bacterium]